jgi:hypothetical protein
LVAQNRSRRERPNGGTIVGNRSGQGLRDVAGGPDPPIPIELIRPLLAAPVPMNGPVPVPANG